MSRGHLVPNEGPSESKDPVCSSGIPLSKECMATVERRGVEDPNREPALVDRRLQCGEQNPDESLST